MLAGITLCWGDVFILMASHIRCRSTNCETRTYLCVEFHFEAEIFGRQGDDVAVSVVKVSLGGNEDIGENYPTVCFLSLLAQDKIR